MSGIGPIDQGAIMASGRSLIPDYAAQLLREQLTGIQQQEANTGTQREVRLREADARTAARQTGFHTGFEIWLRNPTVNGITRLMAAFPEYAETARKAHEVQDEGQRTVNRRALGDIFGALANGRTDLAITNIEARRRADAAAGADTADEDALLEMLRSNDPEQHRRARGMIAFEIAGQLGEEQFSAGLDRLLETLDLPDFEQYARALALTPGTDEYRDAMRDYVLRGSGPTAHEFDVEMEGARQENRLELEGESQENRVALEGVRERNRRTRPPPPRQTNALERIRTKIAAGERLTPGEQRLWDSSQPRRGRRGGGGGGSGAIIVNPRTGQRMQLRAGQWVPVR